MSQSSKPSIGPACFRHLPVRLPKEVMMTDDGLKRVELRLPPELVDEIDRRASEDKRKRNNYLTVFLSERFLSRESQAA